MATTTMTSKGQMTLPKDVRDDLGLKPGDKLDIVKQDGKYVLLPRNVTFTSLAGILGKSPSGPLSVEEEDAALERALVVEEERIRAGH